MIHGLLARPTAAAMTPAPPVQRKAILLPVVAVRPVLPMRAAIAVLRLLLLTAGDEGGQPVDVALVLRAGVRLRPRLKMLLLLMLLMLLRLIVL